MELKDKILSRYTVVFVVVFILLAIVVLKVIFVWAFQKQHYLDFQTNTIIKPLEARRGDIIDTKGRILATTQTKYTIAFDPNTDYLRKGKYFEQNIDALCDSLANVLKDKTASEYKKIIIKARNKKNRDLLIANEISYFTFKRIQKFPIFKKGKIKGGFKYEKHHEPILLHNDLGRRTIGFENSGQKYFGIQLQMNNILKGVDGKAIMQNLGNNIFIEQTIIKKPEDGNSVVTTIDINIQDLADKILRKQLTKLEAYSGVVIIMEVKTGKIRALVNLTRQKDSSYAEIQNLAVSSIYEPGSVMKLASIIAALEKNPNINLNHKIETGNGIWQITKSFAIRDYNYKDGGFGTLTVREVFEKSSNIGVAKIIQNTFSSNPAEFADRFAQMHLDKPLDLRLEYEPTPQMSKPNTNQWSGISYLQMSYGYEISLTPMHLVTLYNAIANNGKMVKPIFVERIEKDGKLISKFDIEVISDALCTPNTVKIVQDLLLGVVENGTGKDEVKSQYLKIAGKSGTANIYNKLGYETSNVEATFIGYFPANAPKYTCLVWISKPKFNKSGSSAAGSVLKKIAEAIFTFDPDLHQKNYVINNYASVSDVFPRIPNGFYPTIKNSLLQNNIKFSETKAKWVDPVINNNKIAFESLSIKQNLMPNVIGMNARDAVYLLQGLGLKVSLSGFGTVALQSIEPGARISKYQKVKITLKR